MVADPHLAEHHFGAVVICRVHVQLTDDAHVHFVAELTLLTHDRVGWLELVSGSGGAKRLGWEGGVLAGTQERWRADGPMTTMVVVLV